VTGRWPGAVGRAVKPAGRSRDAVGAVNVKHEGAVRFGLWGDEGMADDRFSRRIRP